MNLKRIGEIIKSYNFRTVNFRLIVYVIVLSIIGINVISSATDDITVVYKQIIGLAGGIFLMIIFILIRYDFIVRYYWIMYFVAVILLALVITPLGTSSMGAQRWIKVFGIKWQPSEFAKLFLIIFFATLIAKNQQTINSWKFLVIIAVLMILPFFLIYKEPDLSTSIVLLITLCAIIFASDLQSKYIKRIILIALPLLIGLLVLIIVLPKENNIIEEYQYNRLVGFYDADNEDAAKIRYQQENSVIAIANGGLTGQGLNNNSITSVKNADFISEPQTDFIFTIVGEELGFLGSMTVVILLALITFECFRTGIRARENIGKGIAIGVGSWIGFQTIINLGVVTMLLPNTGLTLPFVSAGLSSLLILFVAIGIVINIGMYRKTTF